MIAKSMKISDTDKTDMMNIDEIKYNVDQVLADKGMVKDYPDQNVRQMLYHLYIAIDT